jgi:hypothetical protein
MKIPNTINAKVLTKLKDAGEMVGAVTSVISVRITHGMSSCTPTSRNMLMVVITRTSV